jgi:hypothetical protein
MVTSPIDAGVAGSLATEGAPQRGDGVVYELHDLVVRDGAEELVDTRDAEHVRRERTGESVCLEHDQVGVEIPTERHDVVDHVVRRDLTEESRKEVVVDPLRGDPVAGVATDTRLEPSEPLALTVAGGNELGGRSLDQGRGLGCGGNGDLITAGKECFDKRQEGVDVSRTGCGNDQNLHDRQIVPLRAQTCTEAPGGTDSCRDGQRESLEPRGTAGCSPAFGETLTGQPLRSRSGREYRPRGPRARPHMAHIYTSRAPSVQHNNAARTALHSSSA